jgi:hypothetical protein
MMFSICYPQGDFLPEKPKINHPGFSCYHLTPRGRNPAGNFHGKEETDFNLAEFPGEANPNFCEEIRNPACPVRGFPGNIFPETAPRHDR